MRLTDFAAIPPDQHPSARPTNWREHLGLSTECNADRLIRLGIVVGVVLVSAVLPARVALGNSLPSLLFLACLGLGATVFFISFPYIGITALLVAGLLVPFSIGTGTQTGINISILLLSLLIGLWLLGMLVRQRRISLMPARPFKPLLVFVGLAIVSYGFGQLNWLPIAGASEQAQIAGLAVFVLSAGAFLLAAHQLRRQYMLERLTWVFLALGALYIFGRILPQFEHYTTALYNRAATAESMFWTWLVALAFSQAVFNNQLAKIWRLALALLVIGTFYVSLGQAILWASGWLPPIVAVTVSIFAANPKRALPLLLCVGVILLIQQQTAAANYLTTDKAYDILTRAEAAKVLLSIIKLSPIFGLGPANYYWYSAYFPILGYYVPFNSHNNYIDLVAETGLVGLACFTWFAVELGLFGWRLRTSVSEGFAKAYVYGALGGLAGTLFAGALGDWIIPFVYNIGLEGFRTSVFAWIFLGGLVALHHSHQSGESHSPVAASQLAVEGDKA